MPKNPSEERKREQYCSEKHFTASPCERKQSMKHDYKYGIDCGKYKKEKKKRTHTYTQRGKRLCAASRATGDVMRHENRPCASREFARSRTPRPRIFNRAHTRLLTHFISSFIPCDILVPCAALAESRCWYLQTKLCTSFLNKYEVYISYRLISLLFPVTFLTHDAQNAIPY